MNREYRRNQTQGMTLVEIIVASALFILVMGGLIYTFTQFRRGYEKGESSAVVLQEGAFLLGQMRSDLINAVLDKTPPPSGRWQDTAVRVETGAVSFLMFSDDQGHTERVRYEYHPHSAGGSITRTQGNGSAKTLVNKRVASLVWFLGEETAPGPGSGVRRLWVDLSMTLGGQGKVGMTSRPSIIATKLFPVRLNRQLNGGN